jgi:hypothetical protein
LGLTLDELLFAAPLFSDAHLLFTNLVLMVLMLLRRRRRLGYASGWGLGWGLGWGDQQRRRGITLFPNGAE